MDRILECVPNFSEGRNFGLIREIINVIQEVPHVKLLGAESGAGANRSVFTFVGEPEQVVEAAFRAIRKASQLIDMRQHRGEHPRIGATDVCPLVPVKNISMAETIGYARQLAHRVGEELDLPVYCYEEAALKEERQNLAYVRKGEYENLEKRIGQAEWQPDFGSWTNYQKSGAVIIGARKFLVAYNFNLNTNSIEIAKKIAATIRESGGWIEENGQKIRKAGKFKALKSLGWYIEEYNIAQVSCNLTDIEQTPLHLVHEAVCEEAEKLGARVTGGELIGLIPLKVMTEAGKFYLEKKERQALEDDWKLAWVAADYLGLSDLKFFELDKKVIEYMIYANQTISQNS